MSLLLLQSSSACAVRAWQRRMTPRTSRSDPDYRIRDPIAPEGERFHKHCMVHSRVPLLLHPRGCTRTRAPHTTLTQTQRISAFSLTRLCTRINVLYYCDRIASLRFALGLSLWPCLSHTPRHALCPIAGSPWCTCWPPARSCCARRPGSPCVGATLS